MLEQILLPIHEHLQKTQELLIKSFRLKSGQIQSIKYVDLSQTRSSLVILSASMFGRVTPEVIFLATIIQFIYIAFQIQNKVDEENGYQYPILEGDYFYSKFFFNLFNAGLIKYLRQLSEVICYMNEGGVLKITNPGEIKEVIKRESAELSALSCRLGGELGGAQEPQLGYLYNYGFNLGMGFGLFKEECYERAKPYFNEAKNQLDFLPAGEARDVMEQLIFYYLYKIR